MILAVKNLESIHHTSVVRDVEQRADDVKEIRDIWLYGFILFLGLMLFVGFIGPLIIHDIIDIRFYWYNFRSTIKYPEFDFCPPKKPKINLVCMCIVRMYIDYKLCIASFFKEKYTLQFVLSNNFLCDTSYQRPRINVCFSNSKISQII